MTFGVSRAGGTQLVECVSQSRNIQCKADFKSHQCARSVHLLTEDRHTEANFKHLDVFWDRAEGERIYRRGSGFGRRSRAISRRLVWHLPSFRTRYKQCLSYSNEFPGESGCGNISNVPYSSLSVGSSKLLLRTGSGRTGRRVRRGLQRWRCICD